MSMLRLSAIVITRNEARNIADCLASVAFCDERIVVDCGSNDDTVAVAEKADARVVHHPFKGFGEQKNFALALAAGAWVLSVRNWRRRSRRCWRSRIP
jgi:glycosyltransferase involved in cell wall biosynthesis